MLSERRGGRADPETGAREAGSWCSHRRLHLCAWRSVTLPSSCSPEPPNLDPTTSPTPFIPHLFPWLPHSCQRVCVCVCVFVFMYARLLTRVSHRSLPSCRLPSWGDAWVPPVNFTAFICPDEWRAALSVPLPAISSGSPEPHRFARPLSLPSLLPGPHTNTAEVQNHAQTTPHVHAAKRQVD